MNLNAAQRELRAYLEGMVTLHQRLMPHLPEGFTYWCKEDYLLTNGVWYTPRPLPKRIKPLLPRYCFGNSALMAIRQHKDRLVYVEGIALSTIPFPVHHAWNADKDGNIVDTTWNPVGTAYLGCVFKPRDVNRLLIRGCTPLDNWMDGHPLLKGSNDTGNNHSTL